MSLFCSLVLYDTPVNAHALRIPVPGCPNAENEDTDEAMGVPELHEHSTDLEGLMQGLVSVDQVCCSEAIIRIGNALPRQEC